MKDNQKLIQALMDISDEILIVIDSDFNLQRINQTSGRVLPWEVSKAINQNLLQSFDVAGIESPLNPQHLASVVMSNPLSLKETVVKSQGKSYRINWKLIALPDQLFLLQGKYKQVCDASFDLKNLKENFQTIFDCLPCIVYWKDQNSIYRGVNRTFLNYTGYSHFDEVIGKSDFDLSWKDQASSFVKDDKEVMTSGKPKLNIHDVAHINDGTTLNVLSNKTPLQNGQGKVIGVLGLAINITDLKKYEISLEKSLLSEKSKNSIHEKMLREVSKEILGLGVNFTDIESLKILVTFLKAIVADMPGNVYWKNLRSVYMGCNNNIARISNFSSRKEIIGLTDIDLEKECIGLKERLNDLLKMIKKSYVLNKQEQGKMLFYKLMVQRL